MPMQGLLDESAGIFSDAAGGAVPRTALSAGGQAERRSASAERMQQCEHSTPESLVRHRLHVRATLMGGPCVWSEAPSDCVTEACQGSLGHCFHLRSTLETIEV